MEKNIAYPTDARLYERARDQLTALAQEAGVELRQSCARLAPRLALQVGRHAHARQVKRMRKALKRLNGYTGRLRSGTRTNGVPLLSVGSPPPTAPPAPRPLTRRRQ